MQGKILISGNINRKIWNAKIGTVLKCTTLGEAKLICNMARKMNVETSRRGATVYFYSELNRDKYLWTSGEPAKPTHKPTLRSVE